MGGGGWVCGLGGWWWVGEWVGEWGGEVVSE